MSQISSYRAHYHTTSQRSPIEQSQPQSMVIGGLKVAQCDDKHVYNNINSVIDNKNVTIDDIDVADSM